MNKKKIICMFVILLFIVTTYPLSANITSSNQRIEPEGRVISMAYATGPCLVGWNDNPTNPSGPFNGYLGPAKGFIINIGTTLYHNINGQLTNYLSEDNDEEVLWKVREKTLLSINWKQKEVSHHLQIICKPQEETCSAFFINDTKYSSYFFGCPRGPGGVEPEDYISECLAFTGFHRNGSKTESISGFCVFAAFDGLENYSSVWPEPIIMMWLFSENFPAGELEFFHAVIWSKNGWDMSGTIIEKAKTFNVNFWTLKLK